MQNEDKSWRGVDVSYSKALINAIGCKHKFVVIPWARALELLKSGDIDLMVNVTKSAQRARHYHFIGPQRYETIRLVSRTDAFKPVKTWQQFAALDAVLLRQKGSLYDKKFENALRRNTRLRERLVQLTTNEINMSLLKKGRIDGMFIEQFLLDYRIKNDKTIPPIEIHPLVMSRIPVYYAFSKKNYSKQQIAKFEQVFNQLRKSEAFRRLSSQ